MTKYFTIISLIILCIDLQAQNKVDITAIVTADGINSTKSVAESKNIKVKPGVQITQFDLSLPSLVVGQRLLVDCQGATLVAGITNDYSNPANPKTFQYTGDIANKYIDIKLENGAVVSHFVGFKFTRGANVVPAVQIQNPTSSAVGLTLTLQSYLAGLSAYYKQTSFGLVDPNSDEESVHIFFNQYGNSLLGTIPQGISNKQYIIHIIYLGYSNKPDDVDYSIRQKTGTFNSALVLNNTGILNNVSNFQASEIKLYDQWHEKTFLLGTATDDITFDILATTEDDDGKPVKMVLDTYTIKMSPVFHGSFDIGLLNTNLSTPNYTFVNDPNNSAQQVVKENDGGSHGVVTVMATLYTSPILAIEKLVSGRKIPTYKLSGRNFLDDHRLLERIYPAIGVGINSKSFENLFFGLNWEVARGFSAFGGIHYAKVNTFDMPSFTPGVTPVTQAQFDYYSGTKWKTDWAFGAKLDIMIITNLFKK